MSYNHNDGFYGERWWTESFYKDGIGKFKNIFSTSIKLFYRLSVDFIKRPVNFYASTVSYFIYFKCSAHDVADTIKWVGF